MRGIVSALVAFSALLGAQVAFSYNEAVSPRPNSVSGNYVDSWCSGGNHSDATCTAIARRKGKIIPVIATTRSSVRKYTVCVRNPVNQRRCIKRRLKQIPRQTAFGDGFVFQHKFPHGRGGVYTVTWRAKGRAVGPPLQFKLP